MLRYLKRQLLLGVGVWVFLFSAFFAQEAWLGEQSGDPPPPQELSEDLPAPPEVRERLRRDIENMRIWKMTQYLDLSTEQSAEFFPIFGDFQKEKQKLEQERGEMMHQLCRLVESEEQHSSEIRKLISGLITNQEKLAELREGFRREAEKVLSLKQQAKLIIFEDQFRQEIRRMIEDVRMRRRFHHGAPLYPGLPKEGR